MFQNNKMFSMKRQTGKELITHVLELSMEYKNK